MASSPRKLQHRFEWALVVTLCFLTFAILPSKPAAGGRRSYINTNGQGKEMMKLVLGSRPPRCINKCMNCRPCMAVLVIPPHRKHLSSSSSSSSSSSLTPQEEENYYLLSWKCRCKNKIFPP